MFGIIHRAFESAFISLALLVKQPLNSFCELESAADGMITSDRGDYVTSIEILGMDHMLTTAEIRQVAYDLRESWAPFFDRPGYALQGWYCSDPARTASVIDRQIDHCRVSAKAQGLALEEIFAERSKVWPNLMTWETTSFVLWTRAAVQTREERRQDKKERNRRSRGAPSAASAQQPWQGGVGLAARHKAYVHRVLSTLHQHGIHARERTPSEAIIAARESVYPETYGSNWAPKLIGDDVAPRLPDRIVKKPYLLNPQDASDLLWPRISDQIFHQDGTTRGMKHVELGDHDWASVDMELGPENVKPFAHLVQNLQQDQIPWRISLLAEGGGVSLLKWRAIAASLLFFSENNRRIRNAIESLTRLREEEGDFSVRLRVTMATWAPRGQRDLLRRRAAIMGGALEGWGYCHAKDLAGDPLEGVMSSALGLACGSTAPSHAAPLSEAMTMLPWNRVGSPWTEGSVMFRTPGGRPWPVDVTGKLRSMIFDCYFGQPGHGKSMLMNSMNLGLILSAAAQATAGWQLPMIGVLDIGPSAKGLVDLLTAALPTERRHEAVYIRYEASPEFSVNPLDTQLGFRHPLPTERAFLQNLLSLACTPLSGDTPVEGMDSLIGAVLVEVYRMFSDEGGNTLAKPFSPGIEPDVDAALQTYRIKMHVDATWWDVVDALCECAAYKTAMRAQRHAVPTLEDLILAARAPSVMDQFFRPKAATGENLIEFFTRYITTLIDWLPNLSRPTAFDTGEARVIVLDLEDVALSGSPRDNRQTEMMYMMGRHILARNMFVRTGYYRYAPKHMQSYYRKRFRDIHQSTKRFCYDEFHRVGQRFSIVNQVQVDRREGRKHNVQVGLSSQMLEDFPKELISQATGVFILGTGNEETNTRTGEQFGLTEAGCQVVRHRLRGPGTSGEGAPFLAKYTLRTGDVEQLLYNSLGPVELWALSTRPVDAALRDRMYEALGESEAWKRLSRVFPQGTAEREIERRRDELVKRGLDEGQAQANVIEQLAIEMIDGIGVGIVLRPANAAERGGVEKRHR